MHRRRVAWVAAGCFLSAVTAAQAIVVHAQDDAGIVDIAKNGRPDSLTAGTPEIRVSQSASLISAGVFEFDLAAIPACAKVARGGVTLQLEGIDLGGSAPAPGLVVRGYAGNGNVELADFNAGEPAGAFAPRLGPNRIPIAEAFVQAVLDGGGRFVGLVVSENPDPDTLDYTAVDFAAVERGVVMAPSLDIELEAEEPLTRLPEVPSFSVMESAAENVRNNLGPVDPRVNLYQEDTVLGPPDKQDPLFRLGDFPFPPRIQLLGVPLPAPDANPDIDVDGISFGRPDGLGFVAGDLAIFFSVRHDDAEAEGLGDVALEADSGAQEPISDIFLTDVACAPGDNTQLWDGNGLQSAPDVGPSPGLGLFELSSGGLDALDMRMAEKNPAEPIFWTVTKATAEAHDGPLEPFAQRSGADLFVSGRDDHYPDGIPTLYAGAGQLDLTLYDDVDALVVADDGAVDERGHLFFDPAQDLVYLSLADGSFTLSILGWSPGDVLSVGLGQRLAIFVPAAKLGLVGDDDLDALDLVPRAELLAGVAGEQTEAAEDLGDGLVAPEVMVPQGEAAPLTGF